MNYSPSMPPQELLVLVQVNVNSTLFLFRKPDKFVNSEERSGHVAGVLLEKTFLREHEGTGKQTAAGTGQYEELSCGLVLKSIGYKSVPVDGLPFDHHKGIVPNVMGRVLSNTGEDTTQFERGLYVSGWLKRGPTGIVATNLYCAEETVASITEDIKKGEFASTNTVAKPGKDGLIHILSDRNVKVAPYSGWEKIDNEEKRLGGLIGKPREKLQSWNELLQIAID